MNWEEIDRELATMYPTLILFEEAAKIARRPLGTIYDWSSQGFFKAFKVKRGRTALLARKEFVKFLCESEEHDLVQLSS